MESITVKINQIHLPDGTWLREVKLKQLDGYDEQYFSNMRYNSPSIPLITLLLKRLVRFGKNIPKSEIDNILKKLTIGDRTLLLLQLRKLMFGNNLDCVIICPSCKEKISLQISINDFSDTVKQRSRIKHIKVKNFVIRIKPITIADEEFLLNKKTNSNSVEMLARSCIVSSMPKLPDSVFHNREFLRIIGESILSIDPLAEIILDQSCPICQHVFQVPFVADDFILKEIMARQKQLEHEIHLIAFNYHWNENEILCLPMNKRKKYVNLINKTLSGDEM